MRISQLFNTPLDMVSSKDAQLSNILLKLIAVYLEKSEKGRFTKRLPSASLFCSHSELCLGRCDTAANATGHFTINAPFSSENLICATSAQW